MSKTTKLFANNLRGLIDKKGMQQKDFAILTNTPQSTASMWITGVKLPRPEALEMIAAFFGVCVADLFAEPGNTPKAPASEAKAILEIFNSLDEASRSRLLAYAEGLRDMQKGR